MIFISSFSLLDRNHSEHFKNKIPLLLGLPQGYNLKVLAMALFTPAPHLQEVQGHTTARARDWAEFDSHQGRS